MKRRLPTRALAGLAVAGVLLYAAFGWFVLVSPKRSEAARLAEEVTKVEAELDQRRALANRTPTEVEPIAVADIFRLTKAMPNTADMPGILLELSRIADETGIEFASIAPQTAVPQQTYQVVPINLVFDGNFYELSDFLFRLRTLVGVRQGELEATGRLFAVERLEFSESPGGFPDIQATLVVNAFVYGTGAGAGGVPATPPTTPPAGAPPAEGAQPNPEEPPAAPETAAIGGTS